MTRTTSRARRAHRYVALVGALTGLAALLLVVVLTLGFWAMLIIPTIAYQLEH